VSEACTGHPGARPLAPGQVLLGAETTSRRPGATQTSAASSAHGDRDLQGRAARDAEPASGVQRCAGGPSRAARPGPHAPQLQRPFMPQAASASPGSLLPGPRAACAPRQDPPSQAPCPARPHRDRPQHPRVSRIEAAANDPDVPDSAPPLCLRPRVSPPSFLAAERGSTVCPSARPVRAAAPPQYNPARDLSAALYASSRHRTQRRPEQCLSTARGQDSQQGSPKPITSSAPTSRGQETERIFTSGAESPAPRKYLAPHRALVRSRRPRLPATRSILVKPHPLCPAAPPIGGWRRCS